MIYPVGSIYLSVTDSTVESVITRFGGTWVRIAEGETLFGYKSGDSNFGTAGGEGGAKTINIQHKHTVDSHSHTIDNQSGKTGTPSTTYTGDTTLDSTQIPSHSHTATLENTSSVSAIGGSGSAIVASGGNFYCPNGTVQKIIIGNTGGSKSHKHTKFPYSYNTQIYGVFKSYDK